MNEIRKIERSGLEIAVIGMSGRFPGANNVDEFWENLKNGVHSIRFFSDEELLEKSSVDPELISKANYVKAKGIIENVEYFDAFFFGYSPIEAEVLDPQIRILYEICWEALEDAGCDPSTYPGAIGMYAGGSSNRSWEVLTIITGRVDYLGEFASSTMSDKDFISTRVSYKLDLKGPSISIYTACSTTLVGIDLACRSLLTGQCDAALVGGVSILPETARAGGYTYEEGLITSPDGYVRSFDAQAKGVVFSQGGGVVLLKRLESALADGDHIYAVIKGFAANNDGMTKSSFPAPAIGGQTEAIKVALSLAEVEPESITYVEAHGTATEIGDPIEVEALRIAFNTDKRHYCAIGSLKTNIGHLDVAAGIAGIIKVALMMKHRQIPPSLNFEKPNPKIDFENSPFFVNTELREWRSNGYPLRAGVSSFGVGGTNAHIVLEEAPPGEPGSGSRPFQLIVLSARSAKALDQAAENFVNYLKKNPDIDLADAAYTLKAGRKSFEHKKMAVCKDVPGCLEIFASTVAASVDPPGSRDESRQAQTHYVKDEKRAVFMFPGQGAQYVDMASGLYEAEPLFREEIDRCFEILKPLMGYNLRDILYPSLNADKSDRSSRPDEPDINQTEITQPIIFVIEYALAKLLMAWGVKPYAMIGHSIGEYTAACLAGVFSLEDALTVVAWRGKLMQQMPAGAMLSVTLPEEELKSLMIDGLDLAAVNGRSHCVISGSHETTAAFASKLEDKKVQYRKLHTSHAYHSRMMDPILDTFAAKVGQVSLHEPRIPFISNVTGSWINYQDAVDPKYWSKHVRSAVRFAAGAAELLKEKHSVFIEVGPGRTLNTFIRQHPDKQPEQSLVNLVRHPNEEVDDLYYLLNKIGQIWLYGMPIDWPGFYAGEKRNRLRLPTYPFQRQPYWINGNPMVMIREGMSRTVLPGKRHNMTEWFYIPSWKRSIISSTGEKGPAAAAHKNWLCFVGDSDFEFQLIKGLTHGKENTNSVSIVRVGDTYAGLDDGSYTVAPGREEDYEALIEELYAAGKAPDKIVHLWNLTPGNAKEPGNENIDESLDRSFYSLLYLAKALGKQKIKEELDISVLTNGMHEVWDEKVLYPEKAAVMGPALAIPLEYPGVRCCVIDIILPGPVEEHRLIEQLLMELNSRINETVLAYRGSQRLERTFEHAALNQAGQIAPRLRQAGIYLITGGLGGIGLVLARYLAKTVQARLILTGRSTFPAREEWEQWLNTHSSLDKTSRKIRQVKELESLGAVVRVYDVDVSDVEGMQEVVDDAQKEFGKIHGVIHTAGVPGGGIIQLKTYKMADDVLSPKIKGTLTLHKIMQGTELDFLIVCSSVASIIPQIGQVDYTAANSFMDAFAFYKNAKDRTYTVSINWDAWQEVGMAAAAARQMRGDKANNESAPREMNHPLFDHYIAGKLPGGALQAVFTSYFSIERRWVMRDHRSREGMGIVPGVSYLEMAHAAVKTLVGNEEGIVEISNVSFLSPMMAAEGDEREVQMILKQEGEFFKFTVHSRAPQDENAWQSHARGEVAFLAGKHELRKYDLKEIETRCDKEEIDVASKWRPDAENSLLIFGPRWRNLVKIKVGENEGIALLECPAEFRSELDEFTLYPAMLDFGVAFLADLINAESPYIPYAYKKVKVYRPFPARLYSFGRWLDTGKGKSRLEFLRFNLVFLDEEGTELAEIEEFTLLEIAEGMLARLKEKEHGAAAAPGTDGLKEAPAPGPGSEYKELVKDGIAPKEGVEAFKRILFESLPQVVVSTRDLKARIAAGQTGDAANLVNGLQRITTSTVSHARPDITAPYVAPGSETEQKMAHIWQELLGIEQVGVNDDFFELGGDSLKAAAMITKIKQTFNRDILVRDIFNSPRIRDFSKILGAVESTPSLYTPIEPVEKREYYPLTSMQRKLYVLDQMEGIHTAYNLPSSHELKEKPDIERLQEFFRSLIERHESLRTSFDIIDNQPVQVVHEHVDFFIEYKEAGEDELKEVSSSLIRPFDLSRAPLFRVGIINFPGREYIMLVDMHHIISDGISSTIMVRNFSAFFANKEKELSPLPLQYKDYACWQNSEAGMDYIRKQENYWLNRYKGEIPILEIYTDYPRPPVQSFAGDRVDFKFDKTLTRQVDKLIKETGTTLYMVLLAAYNILLAKYSGQEDIIVGSPVAGREHPGIADLVGVFINALAVRNFPIGSKTFGRFLDEVKESALDAFENQDYPFGDLVERLKLAQNVGRNPLFVAELIVQNMDITDLGLDEAGMLTNRYKTGFTTLDLSLEALAGKEELYFSFTYCTALFKRETIEKFIAFFKQVITAAAGNREIKLADIRIPEELEKAEVKAPQADQIEFGF